MKAYFALQIKRSNRILKDFGLNPLIGYILILTGFTVLSFYFFSKTQYAAYLFMLISLGFTSRLSEKKRNDFLKYCFSSMDYLKIRLAENFIVALPFIAFLAFKHQFPSVFILSILTPLMALVNFNVTYSYTLPTPFYNQPFEFATGFRRTFYLFIFAGFLTFMAVSVSNFNLGVFALILVFLTCMSFYSKLENEYYIWSFSDSPKRFLLRKITTGLVYSTFLNAPIFIVLAVFFMGEINTLLIFLLLGYVYLSAIILAKYSSYPNEMNLPQGILIGISFLFPPIIIGIAAFFYWQSVKRLKDILI